jgi:uncharacterized protein YndB with AHSA1/START domain
MTRFMDVKVETSSAADPTAVFDLLKNGATWPDWTIFTSYEIGQAGKEDPLGVGSVRVFKTRYSVAHERIIELQPNRRLSYELVRGLPLLDYRADVDLEPSEGGGTRIRWHSRFRPRYFGSGWFWRVVMKLTLSRVSTDLAVAASDPRSFRKIR